MSELMIVAISCISICPLADSIAVKTHTHCHQTTTADTSQCAHEIQENHVFRNSAPETSQEERYRRGEETGATTEDIGKAAVQRLKRGACD